jgi:sugar lactone lactonase YvrE
MGTRSLRAARALAILAVTGCGFDGASGIAGDGGSVPSPSGATEKADAALPDGGSAEGGLLEGGMACVADVATDATNCGRCGHSCLGAACVNGICESTALVAPLANTKPWSVAVTSALVYWTYYDDYSAQYNGVWYAPKGATNGSAVRIHNEDISHPQRIVTDGTNVYWTDYNNDPAYVLRCPVGAKCAEPTTWRLASNEKLPDGITFDATSTYWTRRSDGELVRCAISGCGGSPSVIVSSEGGASGIAALVTGGATRLFWTRRGATGSVRTCLVNGGGTCTAESFAATANDPAEIVVFGDRVYWTNVGSGEVRSCAVSGCTAADLPIASGQTELAGLAVDASGVYWVAGSESTGAVRMCPHAGCGTGPVTIAGNLGKPHGIALDASFVYFTALGDGSIRRVAK